MNDSKNIINFKQIYAYKKDVLVATNFDHNMTKYGSTRNVNNYIIFCLCHKGRAKLQINDKTRDLHQGSHIIIIPSTYTGLLEASSDYDATFIAFSPEFRHENRYRHAMPFIDALLFIKEQGVMQLSMMQQEFFIMMRDILIRAIKDTASSYVRPLLEELTSAFLVWEESTVAANINISPTNKNPRDIMVSRFLHLANENYRKQHRLDFYAQQMHITPKYLSAIVKQVTGRTASQWIDAFLVSEAQNLLTTTSKNVAEISDQLGFPNQSFFGKYFKHHTGKSPLSYRYKSPNNE